MKRIPLRARDGSIRAHALVDDEDYERFGGLRWGFHSEGYAKRMMSRPERHTVYLHREIMGLTRGDGLEVDHRNGDRLDFRRSNLRVVPKSGNRQNVPARGGSSRFRGVFWYKRYRRWTAHIKLNGRCVFVGYFEDELEAARAVDARRRELMPFALPDPALVEALSGARG